MYACKGHKVEETQEDGEAPEGQERGVVSDSVNEDAGEREDKEMLPELIRKADEEEDKGQGQDGKKEGLEKRGIQDQYDNEDGDDNPLLGGDKDDAKHDG